MHIMDEHVQRNENKKHRKLVRSYEQISPACDILPSPTGGTTEPKQTSPSMTMVLPPTGGLAVNPITGSSIPTGATIQSPKTPSPNLISPQTLSKSFEHAVAQSPPKYQMYHQFSRKSNTTQQFVQRQQQLKQSLSQTQLPSPTHQHSALGRKPSLTQPATGVETTDTRTSNPKPTSYYHHSLQQSKPMDQRSNNPFILNFNNISGCCIKNSPPSSTTSCSSSPTTNPPITTIYSQTNSTPSPSVPARRSRSLMLKSSSPLQQPNPPVSQMSTPLASTPGPPVPPRLSKSPTPTKETAPPSTATSSTITTSTTTNVSSVITAPTITSTSCYVTLAPTTESGKQREISPPMLLETTASSSATSSVDEGSSGTTVNVRKKRDDFLKATMKICLVVSPPSCKLQLKSRSLSHLDKIEPQITTPSNISADHHQFDRFKNDNSDTSNTSIASASGSIGYGSRVVGSSICYQSSTEGPSPGETVLSPSGKESTLLVATTSGSALIGLSDSDGGCINPAYDNGDGNCPIGTKVDSLQDGGTGEGVAVATCGESTTSSTSNENSNQTCCLVSPSCPKNKSLSTSTSLKKKSSSFLHRERKKPVLTRSQVSSSEYFSVYFEASDNNGFRDEVMIPATKGICLADSLYSSLSQRSLSFSQICVTDNGFSNSHELGIPYLLPLDAYTDISSLAGRTVSITDKESTSRRSGGHVTLQKAASVGYRSTSNRLFTSTSTDEPYDQSPKASSSSSNKQSKQKWTISFGSKGPQKSKLCELLDSYNKGIPKLTSSASNFDNPDYLEALDGLKNLPQSWTDIVNYNGMSETETKIQSAIWELVTTEVYYILALQTVTDLFLACLEDIQSHNILTDVDQNKLFSNIRDICESNLKFWTKYLYPMVKDSVETKDPMSVYKFKDGFMEFSTIFTPYTKYCAEQSTCQYYCKELYQNNSLFMSYCAWCESQKMCNRLRLADILVRPMQRLTKYGLLLAAIKKHITDENEGEAIDEMIHSVEVFVAGVNNHLTTRQENERLKGINARIESYDVVDSNNENLDKMVRQYSSMFDLCLPMQGSTEGRKLFLEGDLKFKDSLGKIDVHCFLLTDFLLVCKKNKHENLKVVRQPYMTDRLVVQIKEQTLFCCYLNELSMVVAAFTLQCSKAQNWYDSITKAKHIYTRLKQGIVADVRQYGNIINIGSINSNMNINNDSLSIRKSPLNSSIGSRVSSLNNSHSGSVDLNESKPVSIDFEKANSLSSDEGGIVGVAGASVPGKIGLVGPRKVKSTVTTVQSSSNSLTVQPYSGLGQSMPNLNLNSIQNSFVYSNTLSVPGTSATHSHSGMVLLSPSQRGISYPPPSPTRATLRRGFAFSSSIKNPPLIKTRNVASQQSFILSQQSSFNSATLGQHQQCLQTSPSPGSSPNVAFVKRKNSFHSQSGGTDPNTPSGEAT
ncbi:pleckstrin homology domain-containing family G member 5 isoform X1 [Ochlerotatus camptorhynchus]|uniref:pleckstrin homology domain-containing family G member 5 isoform X1 n=1 Tax=Ochlerotatus camptorhynchus TaxID=644619 RepID=UPI0031E333D7